MKGTQGQRGQISVRKYSMRLSWLWKEEKKSQKEIDGLEKIEESE